MNSFQKYKKNAEIIKYYKEQYVLKQQLARMKSKTSLEIPPAPTSFKIPNEITSLYDDIKYTMCRSCRYNGISDFGEKGEIFIDVEITHDCDERGVFYGTRCLKGTSSNTAVGFGRIWIDQIYNGEDWIVGIKYRWEDSAHGVTTLLEFNTVEHEIDVGHAFYNGICFRWPTKLDFKNAKAKSMMHNGNFDFICTSSRRREVRRRSINALEFLENAKYIDNGNNKNETKDSNDDDDDENEKNLPLYVQRLAYYSKVPSIRYDEGVFVESLFGFTSIGTDVVKSTSLTTVAK